MSVKQAVIEGAPEQVDRDLDIDAGGDLSAGDRAREHRACLVAARLDEVCPVRPAELGVVLGLGQQGGQDPGGGPGRHQPHPGAHQRQHLARSVPVSRVTGPAVSHAA